MPAKRTGRMVECCVCGTEFYRKKSELRAGPMACGAECAKKMFIGCKRKPFSDEHRAKLAEAARKQPHPKGADSPLWKGEDATYSVKHIWIQRTFGNPKCCEICGTTTAKTYHWANKSWQYNRDRSDWLRLCITCHFKHDALRRGSGKRQTMEIAA